MSGEGAEDGAAMSTPYSTGSCIARGGETEKIMFRIDMLKLFKIYM